MLGHWELKAEQWRTLVTKCDLMNIILIVRDYVITFWRESDIKRIKIRINSVRIRWELSVKMKKEMDNVRTLVAMVKN